MREGARGAEGDGRMTGTCEDENVTLGIGGDARSLAEIDVVGKAQRVGGGIERDLGHRRLRRYRMDAERGEEQRQNVSHGFTPKAHVGRGDQRMTALAACGFKMSFCTRQDSISPTMISLGLRQSIMWTT